MTAYVALKNGRPSGVGETEADARRYALTHAGITFQKYEWGATGKLFVGSRWTGWEVHPARKLEKA